ncbi:MAG: hypothetical protein N3D73_01095 [Candidatus Diapherotrites archaeon]|nr:hypothetical protein [Candidatus Diapherotrites archaeon]
MIVVRNPEFFRKAISAISSFISEGNFRFNDRGLFFRSIDPSQIVLVDYFADKKIFDKFDVEPTLIGVDITEFNKVLSRANPEDELSLEIDDSEIKIFLKGEVFRSFSLPLIDISEEEIDIPKIEETANIKITAKVLKEALKDAALFGSSVIFRVNKGILSLESKSTAGSLVIEAKEKLVKINASKEVISKYSLNFLSNIIKEADNDKDIFIALGNDSPMKISYNIGTSKIDFYLAHMLL